MEIEFLIRADAMQRKHLKEVIKFFGVREYFRAFEIEMIRDAEGQLRPKVCVEGILTEDVKKDFSKQYAEYAAFKSKNEQKLDDEARNNPGVFINISERMKQPAKPEVAKAVVKPIKPKKVTKDDLL